jgi:hypothetical protein
MPEIVGEPMDRDREAKLREWLRKPEASNLRMVIFAKARFEKEKALAQALKADGVNNYELQSVASMKAAARYESAAQVLDEIISDEKPYLIPKLKP